ncbi:MAG TPA: thiol:disulfide interchange protein DsbA/DsbL [Burkholderiaceae bacterium]
MTVLRALAASLLLTFFAIAAPAQAQALSAKDYTALPQPQPTETGAKVEVIEFFFYSCPYCNSFDPILGDWVKRQGDKIVFKRVHIDMHGAGPLQRMYYTLEAMGLVEGVHSKIFQAIHGQRKNIRTDAEATQLVASLGIDQAKYAAMSRSFSIESKIRRAKQLENGYKVDGVPTIAIGGRYITSPAQVGEARPNITTSQQANAAVTGVLDALVLKAAQEKTVK